MNYKLIWIFFVSLTLSIGGNSVKAFDIDNIYYELLSAIDRTVLVSGIDENAEFPQGILEIPETVFFTRTFTVVGISENSNLKNSSVKSIVLPKAIRNVASLAKGDFPNLKTITVNEENPYIVAIDNTIFSKDFTELIWCPLQASLFLPQNLNRIGDCAFRNNISIADVKIPNSVSFIGESAFSGCSSLKSCVLPEKIDVIRPHTFEGCESLSSLELPSSLTKIEEYAFYRSGIEALKIPNSASSIGESAFSGCSSLKSCTLPEGIDVIHPNTFEGCLSLSSLKLPASLTVIEKFGFHNAGIETLEIPNTVSFIGESAFSGCSSLKSCTLPEGIDVIHPHTFEGCASLSNIILPQSLLTIKEHAFSHSGIESIIVPNSVTSIGEYVFYSCENLSSCVLPKNIEELKESTFAWCESLKEYTIPSSVKKIGERAFSKSGLVSIEIPNTVQELGEYVFAGCQDLTSAKLSCSIPELKIYTFTKCDNLKSVIISGEITTIKRYAFNECTALETVTLPASTLNVEAVAFCGCSSLSSFIVDENNPNYTGEGPYLLTKDRTGLVCYPAPNPEILEIPEGIIDSNVTYIESSPYLFKEAIFPASLETLSWNTFGAYWNRPRIIFKSTIPPVPIDYKGKPTTSFAFDAGGGDDYDFDIYVPALSVNLYKESYLYHYRIHPMWEAGIDEMEENPIPESFNVYSIDGRLVLSSPGCPDLSVLPAGIYIVNGKKVRIP